MSSVSAWYTLTRRPLGTLRFPGCSCEDWHPPLRGDIVEVADQILKQWVGATPIASLGMFIKIVKASGSTPKDVGWAYGEQASLLSMAKA